MTIPPDGGESVARERFVAGEATRCPHPHGYLARKDPRLVECRLRASVRVRHPDRVELPDGRLAALPETGRPAAPRLSAAHRRPPLACRAAPGSPSPSAGSRPRARGTVVHGSAWLASGGRVG